MKTQFILRTLLALSFLLVTGAASVAALAPAAPETSEAEALARRTNTCVLDFTVETGFRMQVAGLTVMVNGDYESYRTYDDRATRIYLPAQPVESVINVLDNRTPGGVWSIIQPCERPAYLRYTAFIPTYP